MSSVKGAFMDAPQFGRPELGRCSVLNPTPRRRARKPLLPLLAVVIAASSIFVMAAPAQAADDPAVGISARPGGPDGAPDEKARAARLLPAPSQS